MQRSSHFFLQCVIAFSIGILLPLPCALATISGTTDEPAGEVGLPVNPDLSCPGFYVLRTHPRLDSGAGRVGAEILTAGTGLRTLQGGLNFGGQATESIRGFSAFSIANGADEEQVVDIGLNAEAPGDLILELRQGNEVTILLDRRVEAGETEISLTLPPGFYVIGYRPDTATPANYSVAALTSFADRPGGGFQGGVVFGGYHNPRRESTGFGGFCIAEPFDVSVRVLSEPTYGSSGASGLAFSITAYDGKVVLDSRNGSEGTKPLNDTGIDSCADALRSELPCPVAGFPGQDAEFGRDALARTGQLDKTGAGVAGFDFTKLDSDGNDLPAGAANWLCVRDNHTGLIWEVKTRDGGLRDELHSYTWYNPDPSTDGGDPGNLDGGSCGDSRCDTTGYTEAVNLEGLCGASDWRIPTIDELVSIVYHGDRWPPAIDRDYFPNTGQVALFWSASPYAADADQAWGLRMDVGEVDHYAKGNDYRIRLVRGGR